MRMLAMVVLGLLGCRAQSPGLDAGAAPSNGVFVNATASGPTTLGPTTGASASIPIPPTMAGNLLVLGITYAGSSDVGHVTAGDQPFRSWYRSTIGDCGLRSAEVWYLDNVSGGATSVLIEKNEPITFDVFVLEFSGLVTPLPAAAGGDPSMTGSAPPIEAGPGQVIVSTLTSCGTLTGISPSSPFTVAGVKDSGSAAYFIPAEHGFYGGAWSHSGAISIGNTIAFR